MLIALQRIGYLAASQSFHDGTDVLMLTTNMIRKVRPRVVMVSTPCHTLHMGWAVKLFFMICVFLEVQTGNFNVNWYHDSFTYCLGVST